MPDDIFDRVVCVTTLICLLAAAAGCSRAVEPPPQIADRFATVYGARIHFLEAGVGPVVILLHGLADDTTVWQSTVGPLSRSRRVLIPDQIGFGRSDKPQLEYRPATLVDFLYGLMNALGIARASLVGNSLGGWVAALFALQYPGKVDRLVIIGSAGYRDVITRMDPRALDALHLSTRDDIRFLMPYLFSRSVPSDEKAIDEVLTQRVTNGDGYTISRLIDSFRRGDDPLDNRLARVAAPTLVVWGKGDRLVPVAIGERFAHDISGARLETIDNCGHEPQVECAAELNALLLKFLPSAR